MLLVRKLPFRTFILRIIWKRNSNIGFERHTSLRFCVPAERSFWKEDTAQTFVERELQPSANSIILADISLISNRWTSSCDPWTWISTSNIRLWCLRMAHTVQFSPLCAYAHEHGQNEISECYWTWCDETCVFCINLLIPMLT